MTSEDILYKTIGMMFVDGVLKQKRLEDHDEQLKQNAKVIEFAAKMSNFIDDIVSGNIKDFDIAYMKAYDLHQEELKLLGKAE